MVFEKSKNIKLNHNISSLSTEKMLAFLNLKPHDKSETESRKRKAEESDEQSTDAEASVEKKDAAK